MIQRVQTIFLFLISVAMGVSLANPIWEKSGSSPTELAHLTALQYAHKQGVTNFITPVWYLALLMGIVAIVALYAIFQYRNRLLQVMLCAVNAILLTAIMGIVLYFSVYKGRAVGDINQQGDFLLGFYPIVAALLFNMLANRFIRRDEKLVRGSDRLR